MGDDESYGMFRQFLEMVGGQSPIDDESTYETGNLSVLKEGIKEYPASLGLLRGITKVDRRFIANALDREFPLDTAIVLGWAMLSVDADLEPDPPLQIWVLKNTAKIAYAVSMHVPARPSPQKRRSLN